MNIGTGTLDVKSSHEVDNFLKRNGDVLHNATSFVFTRFISEFGRNRFYGGHTDRKTDNIRWTLSFSFDRL